MLIPSSVSCSSEGKKKTVKKNDCILVLTLTIGKVCAFLIVAS